MSIQAPSQYLCDQMKPGDLIYVKQRSLWYRIYRKYFEKDKLKIKVITDWNTPDNKVEYYQEDCVLIYNYELRCVQIFDKQIPCKVRRTFKSKSEKQIYIKHMEISLYNITVVFSNDKTIVFPITDVDIGITSNKNLLKLIDSQELVKEQVNFIKYKGNYFRDYVKNNNLRKWTFSYCNICGKGVTLLFKSDHIDIDNKCICGQLKFNHNTMSYDELAVLYASQTDKFVKNKFKEYWFKERK